MIFDRLEYHRKFRREILDIQKLSPRTYDSYSEQLDIFFNWCERQYFDPVEINSVEALKEYLARIKNANYQNLALCALKKFYDDTLGEPCAVRYIKFAKKPQALPVILSKEEIILLYNNIENEKQKFILLLYYSTGIRKSEMQNLEERDFDLFRNVITIRSGKGNKDRSVSFSPVLKEKFFEYKKFRQEEIKKFHFSPQYFFVGQFGGKYKSSNAFIKRACKKAGIEKRVFNHLIRHCFGTHMREKLIDLATIGELMGHAKNSKQTFLYARLSDTVLKNAGTPLDDLMMAQSNEKLKSA